METYKAETSIGYEVFSANMTMDTQADMYFGSNLSACKSCKCNCRLCLGGKAPDVSCKVDEEIVLKELLAA